MPEIMRTLTKNISASSFSGYQRQSLLYKALGNMIGIWHVLADIWCRGVVKVNRRVTHERGDWQKGAYRRSLLTGGINYEYSMERSLIYHLFDCCSLWQSSLCTHPTSDNRALHFRMREWVWFVFFSDTSFLKENHAEMSGRIIYTHVMK